MTTQRARIHRCARAPVLGNVKPIANADAISVWPGHQKSVKDVWDPWFCLEPFVRITLSLFCCRKADRRSHPRQARMMWWDQRQPFKPIKPFPFLDSEKKKKIRWLVASWHCTDCDVSAVVTIVETRKKKNCLFLSSLWSTSLQNCRTLICPSILCNFLSFVRGD